MGNVQEALFGREPTSQEQVIQQTVENRMTCAKLESLRTRLKDEVKRKKAEVDAEVDLLVADDEDEQQLDEQAAQQQLGPQLAEIRALEEQVIQLSISITSVKQMNTQMSRGQASKDLVQTMWKTQRLMQRCRITGPSEKVIGEIIRKFTNESAKVANQEAKVNDGLSMATEMGEAAPAQSSEADGQRLSSMIQQVRSRKQRKHDEQQAIMVARELGAPPPGHPPNAGIHRQEEEEEEEQQKQKQQLQPASDSVIPLVRNTGTKPRERKGS